jgi:putative addiction module component (TIGR02574 family)
VPSSEEIFQAAKALPVEIRAELVDRLIASVVEDVGAETTQAQLAEVRRRIAAVELDETELIQGNVVLARARRLITIQ